MTSLAVVGATGAVGREVLKVLEARNTVFNHLRLFASARSAEEKRQIRFGWHDVCVEDLATADFGDLDFAIFSAGSKVSLSYAPIAKKAGCVVIDNSSAFRMDIHVPLVVPEINAQDLAWHEGIIANPNCTTAITLMALYPLHQEFGAKRVSITSYQAASGAGANGLKELQSQLAAYVDDTRIGSTGWKYRKHSNVFPQPIALNVFPHIGTFLENGWTDEEMKFTNEGRKIMNHPSLKASATCVRVPVERAHSVDVLAQFAKTVDISRAYAALDAMRGLNVCRGFSYPMPFNCAGNDNCAVGRVRVDEAFENSLRFWVVGDQLLKGAALNAVQILECLMK